MQSFDNEAIVKAIQQGENVQENILKLYNQNMTLIKNTCLKYIGTEPLEDLLQVAFMSLYESTSRYNENKGCKYITYCLMWVKQAVLRYLTDCGSVVRLPAEQNQLLFRYKHFMNDFQVANGRTPTDEEICQGLNISDDNLDLIKLYASGIQSIDEEFETEDSSGTLADTLASAEDIEAECIDSIYSEYEKKELWAIVDEVLIDSQADVIKKRYQQNETYNEIAQQNGYTFQRARQLEQEALRKLRHKRKRFETLCIPETLYYCGGLNRYKEHNFTSNVEQIAIRKAEARYSLEQIERRYEELKRLAEK